MGEMAPDELKLHCLLYYAQAWHLAIYDVPLFDAPIIATESGPRLSDCGMAFQRLQVTLSPNNWDHFDKVVRRYASLTPEALARRVRSEPPWIIARDLGPLNPEMVIRQDDMRLFYRYGSEDLVTRAAIALCRAAVGLSVTGAQLQVPA